MNRYHREFAPIKCWRISFILLLFSISIRQSFAGEDQFYKFNWLDDDEKVFVLQNKEYVKRYHFGIDVSALKSNSSTYENTQGLAIAVAYYLSETSSIDLTYKRYLNSDNSDYINLQTAYGNQVKPLVRKFNSAALAHLNWIPFYGKMNVFNKFFYFDGGVGLGGGLFQAESNHDTFLDNTSAAFKSESIMGIDSRVFAKFYLGKSLNLNIEYDLSAMQASASSGSNKSMIFLSDIMIGIGFIL